MNREITEKIRKLRQSKGISQTEMADRLNITRSAYHNLELGDGYSWAKYLNELMTVFDTTPGEFFSDIGQRVITQHNHKGAQGYIVEHMHQESRDMYEKLISAKDEQIALLKDILGEKK